LEILLGISKKKKKTIKIRPEIKSKNFECWSLLVPSYLGNRKSYNFVAILKTGIFSKENSMEKTAYKSN
jgi:hypothetical protein